MAVSFKEGVLVRDIDPFVFWAIYEIDQFVSATGEFTVTSLRDGKHKVGSLHYVGRAFDIRTRHIASKDDVYRLAGKLGMQLGGDWDIVVEADHIHVEYDPS